MKRRWYEIKEGWKIAWSAIAANRLRAMLATLGIVVGIVTVTLMGMAIEGMKNAVRGSLASLGADTLHIQRRPWRVESYLEWLRLRSRRNIDESQVRALEKRNLNIRALAPFADYWTSVEYLQRSASDVLAIGTTDQFQITAGLEIAHGRFFTSQEVLAGRAVCVLGSQVASNLFLREDPLGRKIRIDRTQFEVIGVLTRRGNLGGRMNLDNQVMMPLEIFKQVLYRPIDFAIQIKALSIADLENTEEEIRTAMRVIRKVPPGATDDFSINQLQSVLGAFERVSNTMGGIGLFISGLSLLVGGIGIMNIMFVSVAERTREIGIRKAIGAKRRSILIQFLIESGGICLLGGVAGIVLAWLASFAIPESLPVQMSYRVALLAVAVSVTVGIISGVAPAWRAAKLNPVEALRQE